MGGSPLDGGGGQGGGVGACGGPYEVTLVALAEDPRLGRTDYEVRSLGRRVGKLGGEAVWGFVESSIIGWFYFQPHLPPTFW